MQGGRLFSHDYTFWSGDFNYRVDLPIDEVKECVRQRKWDELIAEDQLTKEKAQHKVCSALLDWRVSSRLSDGGNAVKTEPGETGEESLRQSRTVRFHRGFISFHHLRAWNRLQRAT